MGRSADMGVLEALWSPRSMRGFLADEVPRSTIEEILRKASAYAALAELDRRSKP
jgi:hypothetical protein